MEKDNFTMHANSTRMYLIIQNTSEYLASDPNVAEHLKSPQMESINASDTDSDIEVVERPTEALEIICVVIFEDTYIFPCI